MTSVSQGNCSLVARGGRLCSNVVFERGSQRQYSYIRRFGLSKVGLRHVIRTELCCNMQTGCTEAKIFSQAIEVV